MKMTEKMARDLQYWFGPSSSVYEAMTPVEVGMTVEAKMTVNRVSVLRRVEEESAA